MSYDKMPGEQTQEVPLTDGGRAEGVDRNDCTFGGYSNAKRRKFRFAHEYYEAAVIECADDIHRNRCTALKVAAVSDRGWNARFPRINPAIRRGRFAIRVDTRRKNEMA